jgi:hypothetical protein
MAVNPVIYSGAAAAFASTGSTTFKSTTFLDALQTAVNAADKTQTSTLDSIFQSASEDYGVSIDLLKAVAKAESDFDTDAVSSCGAQGIMQLMPSTASSLGVTNAFDAEQNIRGGAKLLSGLLAKYDGNTELALAAYNAGSGNVEKYGGIPPFQETRNYIQKVITYANGTVTIPASSETEFHASTGNAVFQAIGSKSTKNGNLRMMQLLAEQMKFQALSAANGMSQNSNMMANNVSNLYALLMGDHTSNNSTTNSTVSLINSLSSYYGNGLTANTTASAEMLKTILALSALSLSDTSYNTNTINEDTI